jgi:hypothetical protein
MLTCITRAQQAMHIIHERLPLPIFRTFPVALNQMAWSQQLANVHSVALRDTLTQRDRALLNSHPTRSANTARSKLSSEAQAQRTKNNAD